MHEEPFRWVEAIANRREYIEDQLAPGSPIVALGFRDGILLAPITAQVMSAVIEGRKPEHDLDPFSPARFQ